MTGVVLVMRIEYLSNALLSCDGHKLEFSWSKLITMRVLMLFDENSGLSDVDQHLYCPVCDSFFNGCICGITVNPANGLPMVGCIDIEGNPYGVDDSDISHDPL